MSKKRIKSAKCLNCDHTLKKGCNYCPVCGQENTDKRISVKKLIKDFLGDFFELDSKLVRSIVPFLFKPGYLTREYNEGKRVKYIPPFRLYIFFSIVYFFLLAYSNKETNFIFPGEEKITDTTIVRKDKKIYNAEQDGYDTMTLQISDTNITFIKNDFVNMIEDKNFNVADFLDSIGVEHNRIIIFVANKALKFYKKKGEGFLQAVLENVPVMMFFFLPVFALLLKIIYIRRKKFYVEHLIFSFHLHSFIFLILFFSLLSDLIFSKYFLLYGLLILFIYAFIAFKKIYQQSWLKTLLKMFLLFLAYVFTISLCFGITILVTFLLF